jgi:hypothetical protein
VPEPNPCYRSGSVVGSAPAARLQSVLQSFEKHLIDCSYHHQHRKKNKASNHSAHLLVPSSLPMLSYSTALRLCQPFSLRATAGLHEPSTPCRHCPA